MELNAEQRIRMTIGDLVVQMEIARDQVKELQAQLEAERAKNAKLLQPPQES
ncbi:MAG: hypothetical protein WCG06_01905 [Candidatus Omnitrophota bacterium]